MGIEFVYPNGSKKALTFTIDDGNIEWDRRFLSILKPHGIRGTFNLCGKSKILSDDELREFYNGYGIANHCKCHPYAMTPEKDLPCKDERFDSSVADPDFRYPEGTIDGLYYFHLPHGWRTVATDECYLRLAKECTEQLEEVFGKGKIKDFVWPFGEQKNEAVREGLRALGFRSIRKTGNLGDSTDFNLPDDRFAWTYNASHSDLLDCAERYERAQDNGRLRFFSFGVHSVDYERAGKWDMLEEFARRYGDRPLDFYYATVEEIFDYEDATGLVECKEGKIVNKSSLTVYFLLDGRIVALKSGESVAL